MKWLIGIGAFMVVVAGGAVAITKSPYWRNTMIRHEYFDCNKRAKNLEKAGRAAKSLGLMIKCATTYEKAKAIAEHFGTKDISKTPTPL